MQLIAFDHVNVHTTDPGALADWYEDIIGLKRGMRPNGLGVDGIWLYLGDRAIVHLVEAPNVDRPAVPAIEHFSLSATGLDTFLTTLRKRGIKYALAEVPDVSVVQVNLADHDGNHIHIDFPLHELQS